MNCKIYSIVGAAVCFCGCCCCCCLDMLCDDRAMVGDGGGESSSLVSSYEEWSFLSEEIVARLN